MDAVVDLIDDLPDTPESENGLRLELAYLRALLNVEVFGEIQPIFSPLSVVVALLGLAFTKEGVLDFSKKKIVPGVSYDGSEDTIRHILDIDVNLSNSLLLEVRHGELVIVVQLVKVVKVRLCLKHV